MDETPAEWKARMGIGQPSAIGRAEGDTFTTVVPHEADGRPAGVQVEHRDGRVDATVFARPVPIITKVPTPQ